MPKIHLEVHNFSEVLFWQGLQFPNFPGGAFTSITVPYPNMLFKTMAVSAFVAMPLATALPGCYQAWRSGGAYFGGSLVSATRIIESPAGVNGSIVKKNFKCISGSLASLSHCPTYNPSNTLDAAAAWSDLGQCNETAPVADNLSYVSKANSQDVGGCPDEYVVSTKYEEGDRVVVDGIVYKCRSWPNSAFCSMQGFEPDGIHSAQAWTLLGVCDGKRQVPRISIRVCLLMIRAYLIPRFHTIPKEP
jgi:hypothetical protein